MRKVPSIDVSTIHTEAKEDGDSSEENDDKHADGCSDVGQIVNRHLQACLDFGFL